MRKKCKGCGGQFSDKRANVKFCMPECNRITRLIKFHEYQIARLHQQQQDIRFYGRVMPRVEKLPSNSTGVVDPYHVPDQWG